MLNESQKTGPVRIVLAGIGGYGNTYVDALLDARGRGGFEIAGFADPRPEACERLDEMVSSGARPFTSLEAFYQSNRADLAVISAPIHEHAALTGLAFRKGSHVLCEKPLCATPEDGLQMITASENARRFIAVGYQWSFSDSVLNFKRDILNGLFGRPLRMKTIVLWPRDKYYFQRKWAGRKYSDDGRPVFDSIAANAAAHYLHNMLFILGSRIDRSAAPVAATAELYRANDIENFDTIALRAETEHCREICFYASHAVNETRNPSFHYVFENADVICSDDETNGTIRAIFNDGRVKDYGDPNVDPLRKLWQSIDAAVSGSQLPCTAETAYPHVLCVNALQRSVPDIPRFPSDMISIENNVVYAQDLFEVLTACYETWSFPADAGLPWTCRGSRITV